MAFVRKVWKNRISEFFNRYRLENVRTGEAFNAYINLNDGAVEEPGDRLNADALNDLEQRIEDAFEDVGGGEDMIAGVEATSTTTQAYTIGQYLIYNKLLYKVTSAIAIGDTLAVGTNIVQKKIAEEVSDHLVVNGTEFYFDTHDDEFGYNTSPNRGADTFHPFKSGGGTFLGQGTSFDLTGYSGYQNLTSDDFIVEPVNLSTSGGYNQLPSNRYYTIYTSITLTKSYNPSTGVLSAYYTVASTLGDEQGRRYYWVNTNVAVKAYLLKSYEIVSHAVEVFHRESHTADTSITYTFANAYDTMPWLFVSYDFLQGHDYNGYFGYIQEGYWIKTNGKYTGVVIRNTAGNGGAITIYVCDTNPFS